MAAPSPVVPQSADKENDGTSSIEAGVAALCSPATSGGGRKRSVPLDDRRPQAADRTPSDVPGVKRHRGNTGSPAAAEDQQAHAAGLAAPSPTQQQHQPEEASSQPSPALEPAGEAEWSTQDVAAEPTSSSGEPAACLSIPLPDWCDRALPLERNPDADAEPFCILPGHPLLALACEGQAALLAKVLDHGADPNAQDSRGLTALHLACRHERLACIKVLLEAGATQVADRDGHTPVELAEAAGLADVVAMVQRHEQVQRELAYQRQQAVEAGCAAAAVERTI